MFPRLALDRQVVTTLHDQVLHLLLELRAPSTPTADRPPLDLVVVIDRSGSMRGAPLRSVTEATAQLLRLAGPDDRIGVVTFDDTAHTVLPLDRHDGSTAGDRIRAIDSGGSTNLSAGWLRALDHLITARRPGALSRILVLTDGEVNVGVTDHDSLATMIAGGAAQGITSSFIGFRDGFDEHLLSVLADAGRGNDYWCADSDQAMVVFGTEFQGLAAVVAQNVTVVVRPGSTVATVEDLAALPTVARTDGATELSLGDAYGDELRRVVLALHLRPIPGDGDVEVGTIEIRWVDVAGDVALHSVTLPVIITADQAAGATGAVVLDPEVTEHVVRLRADQERRRAREAWDRGDEISSIALMQSAGNFLRSSERILPDELLRLDIETGLMASRTFDAAAAKRMHSGMRSRAKGRNLEVERSEPAGTNQADRDLADPDQADPNR